ncbi:MAG: Smr/MutS family protein [Gemmatimonadetes bacterium]|nr:Smr/MutS family protein [Gemmatimonadota bacterium]MBI2404113.1 Smr/MutS family protein [Gemmatimonadota bacterium]
MGRKRRLAQVTGHEAPQTLLGKTPARELDLHGVQSDQAEHLVRDFVMTGTRNGSGQVFRIVTGKGNRSAGRPVLMPLVRRLLETSLAPFVAEFALDRDGGSFLVRLK